MFLQLEPQKSKEKGAAGIWDHSWWQVGRNQHTPGAADLSLHPAHAHKPTSQCASGISWPGNAAHWFCSAPLWKWSRQQWWTDTAEQTAVWSASRHRSLLRTTAVLQVWEIKDGDTQKNQQRQKDRKRERPFFFFLHFFPCCKKSKAYEKKQARGAAQHRESWTSEPSTCSSTVPGILQKKRTTEN